MKLLVITQKVDSEDQLLGFFIDWLNAFAKSYHKVTVLCLEEGRHTRLNGVDVISLGKDKGQSKLKQLFNFYKLIFGLRKDYDAVFVHMNPIWVVLGGWLWRLMGKKVFLWYAHKQVTLKLRLAEKLAHGIFTSTPEGFRLPSAKTMIVGQGINTELFKPDTAQRPARLSILSVGRIAKVKNYETLIYAAEILKHRGLDFGVTIIGSPALEQDKLYESDLKRMIKERELTDRFSFLGKISHSDLVPYYQAHHLFINLAKTGSLDKTIVEAIATGEIVISSNDAAKKILPLKYLVDGGNPVELADRIIELKDTKLDSEVYERIVRGHSLQQLVIKIHNAMSARTESAGILITGYPYIRESYRNTFDAYPNPDAVFFALPSVWKIKKGKIIYHAPIADNIFKTLALFHHSDYPIIGGLLKGWLPFLPSVVAKAKSQHNIGLLYSASEPILLTTLYNGLVAKLFGLKHVIFSWENIPFETKFSGIKGRLHMLILRLNLALSDGIICGNTKCEQIFSSLTNKPLALIPLSGLDVDFYKPGASDFREQYQLKDKILFTFAGAISYRKGIHIIIEALHTIVRDMPKAHLVIAGSGEYESEINVRIERLGISEHITIIPWLDRNGLRELLLASDIFLYPSLAHGGWEEQFGYSMAEASLCELPVIATTSGSIAEVVLNGQTGILIEENNADQLREAMTRLAKDSRLRKEMGQAGRAYIIDNFSNAVIARKFYDFFNNVQHGQQANRSRELIYVTNVRLPTQKAHGLQIMKSCEALARNGLAVRLIAPALRPAVAQNPFDYYGVKPIFEIKKVFVLEVLPLEKRLGRWVGYIQNLSFSISAVLYLWWHDLLRKENILYSRDYMTLWLLSLLGFHPVMELHDYRSLRPKRRIELIVRQAELIVTNSEGTLEMLRKHYVLDESKILVLPNGVDLDFFDIKESKIEARKKLGIPLDTKIIAYVGRLETIGLEKGVSLLLQAFAEVARDSKQDTILYIIGGPDELITKYKEEAYRLDIAGYVVFTGHMGYTSVPFYLRAIDVVVVPFPNTKQLASTASPLKVFEFMAAGKVMIVSDLPSLRRYLNEANALFFKPESKQDLADTISRVLKDSELASRLSANAYKDASKYSWLMRAQKIIQRINI